MSTALLHPAPSYPSILWCVTLDGQGGLSNIDPMSIDSDKLTWVHLHCDGKDSQQYLESIGLIKKVNDALLASDTRPRSIVIEQGLLIYLRGINKNPDSDPEDMVSLRVYLHGNAIITARKRDRSLLSVWDVKTQLEEGSGPLTPAWVICAIIERITDRISETVDDIEDYISLFETELADAKQGVDRRQLATLRRQATSIRRYLAPQREALDALYRIRGQLNDEQAHAVREQSDRLTRYVEDLDLARERTLMLQEELRNQIAEAQGMRMYVLSLVTAIFLPLSFLTGVFGMNVAGLPGTENDDAFFYLMMGMCITAVVLLVVMIWRRWL